MTWLEITNLQFSHIGSKNIRSNGALRDIAPNISYNFDLTLPAGKILALGGRSGVGKSTLLDLIAGFLQPVAGQIILDGHNITTLSPSRRQISLLFQKNNLFEHLTIMENICLGLNPNSSPTHDDITIVTQMISDVGLKGFETRRAGTLSGGQMQRTALARELLRDTKLILLDEPFNGLDEETRQIMLPLLLTAVNDQKRSIILVTHDLQSIAKITNFCAIVEDGKIHNIKEA